MDTEFLEGFYKGKKIFITGHTGFKGTWLCRTLLNMGAFVTGYSLDPPTEPSLFSLAGFEPYISEGSFKDIRGDIRDLSALEEAYGAEDFDVVFHLAAQPIVRESYKNPVYTYETNVMGTVNMMEAIRRKYFSGGAGRHVSVVIITTDKVYKNEERQLWGYREYEPLDGYDPYSNSKSCAELVVHSYRDSFFKKPDSTYLIPISTARAGNVIGGGDFAKDRIIPDCVRALLGAMERGEDRGSVSVRNPYSTRPYQHVLEPLAMYMMLAARQYADCSLADWYNVGPDDCDCVTTGDLVELFCRGWNRIRGELPEAAWENKVREGEPHEAGFLKLDSSKIKARLGYVPRWHIQECLEKTAEFAKIYLSESGLIPAEMDREIREFMMKNGQGS